MSKSKSLSWTVRRKVGAAVNVALGLACVAGVAGAQTAQTSAASAAQPVFTPPSLALQTPSFGLGADDQGFSSSAVSAETGAPDNFVAALNTHTTGLEDAMQYGGRRRYGRPRYRGGNTNADGSQKYTFFVGAGFTAPATQNSNYLKTSWGFQAGFGRNFNRHLGVNLEFNWDNFGFTGQTITNQSIIYFDDPNPSADNGLDGHSHIWSFSLNPIYNLTSGDTWGTYVTAGGGFYHKEATFTIPEEGEGFDPYYGIYEYEANVPIQNYTSNSAGVNGGIGVTYKFSKFSNQRLYAEARIVHTFNQYKPGVDITNYNNSLYTGWNFFPANSQDTTYFPVKFGIRF